MESWNKKTGSGCPNKRSVNIVGPKGEYPYDKVLEVKASGAGGCGGYSDAWQDISVCITEAKPLRMRANVNAVYSSVGDGCGWKGWEYPIRIFLSYETSNGQTGSVEFQFTYKGGSCCKNGSSGLNIIDCNKIPQNSWVEYVSEDLRVMAPQAHRFTQVRIRGHGWDYTGWVASIQLECF